jgi:NADPH-dependent 2,4-dienoyl-CoA reductase/sulfur reductase-like enzyme
MAIEVRTGTEAAFLDATSRKVRFTDGSSLEYDRLLVATGGTPPRRT